jgi:hypothetical protein
MSEWFGIAYREFWDAPRAVAARRGSDLFFFDSRFDENLDDYLDHYEVWRLPPLSDEQLSGSWSDLERLASERLPNVALRDLPFEVSSRNTPMLMRCVQSDVAG